MQSHLCLTFENCRSSAADVDGQHVLWLRSKSYKSLDPGDPDRIRVDAGDIESGTTELWQLRRTSKRQKILIGLAHASSDGVFVGTVDHVMVLPELQNQGLGRRYGAPVAQVPVQIIQKASIDMHISMSAD